MGLEIELGTSHHLNECSTIELRNSQPASCPSAEKNGFTLGVHWQTARGERREREGTSQITLGSSLHSKETTAWILNSATPWSQLEFRGMWDLNEEGSYTSSLLSRRQACQPSCRREILRAGIRNRAIGSKRKDEIPDTVEVREVALDQIWDGRRAKELLGSKDALGTCSGKKTDLNQNREQTHQPFLHIAHQVPTYKLHTDV